MKIIFAIFLALCLSSCVKPPESSALVNQNFSVDELFTHKGCTTYRFFDNNYYHYYTVCLQGRVQSNSNVSCGKNCIRPDQIPTLMVRDEQQHSNQ